MTSLTLSLDKRSLMAYFNGIVLPHLDYADVVVRSARSYNTDSSLFKIAVQRLLKQKRHRSAEAPTLLRWVPLYARRIGH